MSVLMPPDDNWDGLFPRDVAGRLGLGLASLFLVTFSGLMLYCLLFRAQPPIAFADRFMLIAVEEFLLGLFLFFLAGLIWAVFTPQWLERFRGSVARKLALGMLLFIAGAVLWAIAVV